MARKRYSDDNILWLLREIELSLAAGSDVLAACRTAGVSDVTYFTWRKRFGGVGRSDMANLMVLEKGSDHLKKIVAQLELDKLSLTESLDYRTLKARRQTSFITPSRLCRTNPVRDSSRETSVDVGVYEQTLTPDLQDQELATL